MSDERHNLGVIDRRVAMGQAGRSVHRVRVDHVDGLTATVLLSGALLPANTGGLPLRAGDVVEVDRPRGVGGALRVLSLVDRAMVDVPAPADGDLDKRLTVLPDLTLAWTAGGGGVSAHGDLTGVTADQHHAQVHALAGSDHSASGLTTDHVLKATGGTTFGFGQLAHSALSGLTTGNPHTQYALGSDLTTHAALQTHIARGTSFPGSPSTNDLYLRTDRGILYFYDGTRWLSAGNPMITPFSKMEGGDMPYTATTGFPERISLWRGIYEFYLLDVVQLFHIASGGTALHATNHRWQTTVLRQTSTGDTVATLDINSGASATWRTNTGALNMVAGTSDDTLEAKHTKTGTPGGLRTIMYLRYRLIG